jgi:hypothetical protein
MVLLLRILILMCGFKAMSLPDAPSNMPPATAATGAPSDLGGERKGWKAACRAVVMERRCPWKPRSSLFGAIAAGVGVTATAAGLLWGLDKCAEAAAIAAHRWAVNNRDTREEARKRRIAPREEMPEAERKRLNDAEIEANIRADPSLHPQFDDPEFRYWHIRHHGLGAVGSFGLSACAAHWAREPFSFARTRAPTVCAQGGYMGMSIVMFAISAAWGLRAADNAYAWYLCDSVRRAPSWAQPQWKDTRIRHTKSFLRQSPILSKPLATYSYT